MDIQTDRYTDKQVVNYLKVSIREHLFDGSKTVETARHESTERRMSFTD